MAKKRRSRQFKKSSRIIDMDEARRQRQEKRESVRAEEERERSASDERRVRRKRALRKKQSRRKLIVMVVIIALAVILAVTIFDILRLQGEKHRAEERQKELKTEQQLLEEELDNVNTDENIEDKAREKLKLVKPNETIYIPEESE